MILWLLTVLKLERNCLEEMCSGFVLFREMEYVYNNINKKLALR